MDNDLIEIRLIQAALRQMPNVLSPKPPVSCILAKLLALNLGLIMIDQQKTPEMAFGKSDLEKELSFLFQTLKQGVPIGNYARPLLASVWEYALRLLERTKMINYLEEIRLAMWGYLQQV